MTGRRQAGRRQNRVGTNLLLGVLALLLSLATNVASELFPGEWRPYAWLTIPALLVIVLVVAVLQERADRRRPDPAPPVVLRAAVNADDSGGRRHRR